MKKKYAGMPLWAWGLLGAVAIYWWYSRSASSSTAAANTPTSSVLDPNAIDPNTGLTYGQEESAALNQAGAAGMPGTGSGYTGSSGGATGVDSFDQNLSNLLALASAFNLQPGGVGAGIPSGAPATSTPATTSPSPVPQTMNASTPTTAPSVNYQQTAHTALLAQNNTVLGQVNSLLGSGFHKIKGTTQHGGLAQTGTYVYARPKGASFHSGPTKYFVYGTQQTGLHIRPA